ncbi:O-antigen ligase family protein [Rhodovibrionaceae bacterium A322]
MTSNASTTGTPAPFPEASKAHGKAAGLLQQLGLGSLLLLGPVFTVLVPKGLLPLMLVGSLVFVLGCWLKDRRLRVPPLPLSALFTAFVLWAAVTLTWTLQDGGLTHLAGLAFIPLFGLFLAAGLPSLSLAQKKKAENLLLIGFALGLAVLVFEGASGRLLLYTFGEPRDWGFPMSRLNRGATGLALFAWPVVILLQRKGLTWLAWLLVAGLLVTLSFFESLAATVGFAAGALLFLIARFGPKLARLLLLLGLLIALLTPPVLTKQMHAMGLDQDERFEYSLRHRVYIWNFITDRWLEKPVLGWGFNASKALPVGDTPPFSEGLEHPVPSHPHNFALQVLGELGLPGLLLITLIAVSIWQSLRPGAEDGGAEMALMATSVVILMTAYGAWQGQWIANLFLAAAFAYLARPAKEATAGQDGRG